MQTISSIFLALVVIYLFEKNKSFEERISELEKKNNISQKKSVKLDKETTLTIIGVTAEKIGPFIYYLFTFLIIAFLIYKIIN